MLLEKLKDFHLILGTQSPRRHLLMKEAGFHFDIVIPEDVEEKYPDNFKTTEIPIYLAELKAQWFAGKLKEKDIVITADTVVIHNNKIIGKPSGQDEAVSMLQTLRGCAHDVITGVCFTSREYKKTFSSVSTVYFSNFSNEEILYYVDNFKPYDKAGSYGAQEWIGYIGIERIEGSFFNVMGLPIQQLYIELGKFVDKFD